MKQIFRSNTGTILGLLTAIGMLALVLYPGDTAAQATAFQEIPQTNSPVVTVRLIETRTAPAAATPIAAAANPVIRVSPTGLTDEDTAAFYFQQPDDVAPDVLETVNLVNTDNDTYRPEPLFEKPVRVTLAY